MYASQSLLYLLGCIICTSTATSSSIQVSSSATASAPVVFTTDASNGIPFNISQTLANKLSTHFNDTCPAGAGQRRLGKRGLSSHDVDCITNSAEYAVKYAASSSDLQDTLLLFPTDFPSLTGPLVAAINSLAVFIQNPPLFNPNVFSGAVIHAILAVFVGLAFTIWVNGPGTQIIQNMIPSSDLEDAVSSTSSSCSSLTFSFTTPTISSTVVPAVCDTSKNCSPCSPVGTALAYAGLGQDTWDDDLAQYNMAIHWPACWPNTQSMAGPTSVFCVCAGSAIERAFYSTISGVPSESACAYSASSDLPSVQYSPATVLASITTTAKPTSCSPTQTTFEETFLSPAVSTITQTMSVCSCNGNMLGVTSWTLNGQLTVECDTGQTAPTPIITSAPTPPAWKVGFYTDNFPGPCYGDQVVNQPGYPLTGNAAQTCTNMPSPYPSRIGVYVSFIDGNWCATISDKDCIPSGTIRPPYDGNILTYCGAGAACNFLGGGYGFHAYEVHPNTVSTTASIFMES